MSLILCLAITLTIDGNTLNVDRWSAMTVAIEALFKGEYPYTATDHLNGRTSNFPGLIVLGIPFYILGNIGLLQVFSLGLFSFTIYKTMPIQQSTYCLLLLIFSVAFWYEVAVLSDFLSNLLIIFSFILLWHFYNKENVYSKPILLGIFLSILTLTRGIVFIPIALFFFAEYFRTNFRTKIKFSLALITTSLFLIYLVLKDCPSKEILLNFNPLVLQTSYTPMWFNLLAIIVPLICSFFIKNFKQFIQYVIAINIILVLNYFVKFSLSFGFQESIHNSMIDLVYLSYIFPFIWYFLSKYNFNNYSK